MPNESNSNSSSTSGGSGSGSGGSGSGSGSSDGGSTSSSGGVSQNKDDSQLQSNSKPRQHTAHFGSDSPFYLHSADVVLLAGTAEFPAHRLTLARVSAFFLGLFEDCSSSGNPQRIPLDISEEDAEVLLNYCYSDKKHKLVCQLEAEQLRQLARAADRFAMSQALKDIDDELAARLWGCESRWGGWLDTDNARAFLKVENVVSWATFADCLQLPKMLKFCETFMLSKVRLHVHVSLCICAHHAHKDVAHLYRCACPHLIV